MILKEPTKDSDWEEYYHLRWSILKKPWGQKQGSEKDELDNRAYHIMACQEDGKIVGVGRLHFNSDEAAQIRYMAVEPGCRESGIGTMIATNLENKAKDEGANIIVINAPENSVSFFKKMGYKVLTESYVLYGEITHFEMVKQI